MKAGEAQQLQFNSLKEFFYEAGYVGKGKNSFIKKYNGGWDKFAFGMINYDPKQICYFSIFKRIDAVEDILQQVSDLYDLGIKVGKDSSTMAFGPGSLDGTHMETTLPEMQSESDILVTSELIKNFMIKTGFLMLERFNDLREWDKTMNGNDFWETDWRKPFNLYGQFDCKRLIIAYLSSNPDFEKIYQYSLKVREEVLKEFPGAKENVINGKNYLEYLHEVLCAIKPLY
ncbi:hypothetical protein CLV59_108340 [Chitinophaga dinghuensis]|uniref:Uncharacterized protein n=1 Tax=Chitinophaga dinghuensis TaxID=1539050 RepID=A0A327VRY9_9BACT|nr:hypothetical protein [Chitinophaga dinghuensis]RAJ76819.1 hypothetical protein CLV59_108340 [Chitinophaga dinghuensis]